jgi:sugar phosphate isomerase/epimerase
MRPLIVTSHIHDNHGDKDEHLLPYEGDIDWAATLAGLPAGVPLVLELRAPAAAGPIAPGGEARAASAESAEAAVLDAARGAMERLERELPGAA